MSDIDVKEAPAMVADELADTVAETLADMIVDETEEVFNSIQLYSLAFYDILWYCSPLHGI